MVISPMAKKANNAEKTKNAVERNLSQYERILNTAVQRAAKSAHFFRNNAALSEDSIKRSFLLYLGEKKDAQRVVIEKIARWFGITLSPVASFSDDHQLIYNENMANFQEVFEIIHEKASDEFEFYLSYAHIEYDDSVSSMLLMMADLAKEFLFDIKIWYRVYKIVFGQISPIDYKSKSSHLSSYSDAA